MSLPATIESLRNEMRKDPGIKVDADRISQLAWMLLLKIIDSKDDAWEAIDPDYESVVPPPLRWNTWTADPDLTGDNLVRFVNKSLFPSLRKLEAPYPELAGRTSAVRDTFLHTANHMKSGVQLRNVITQLDAIDFDELKERHHLGDIYEMLLSDLRTARTSGEFYTPRAITRFMAEILDPKPGEILLDPACGTGGFLTCSIGHMRAQHVRTADDEILMQGGLRAIEKKNIPHLLCVANMMLHDVDDPGFVALDNTLARPYESWTGDAAADVVLSNPPFRGTERLGVGSDFPPDLYARDTACLFLVLTKHLL